jgi:hypothetical protein
MSAGWYPNPNEHGAMQYWDGQQWATPPTGKPSRKKRNLIIAGAAIVVLGIAAAAVAIAGGGDKHAGKSAVSTSSTQTTATSTPTEPPTTSTPTEPPTTPETTPSGPVLLTLGQTLDLTWTEDSGADGSGTVRVTKARVFNIPYDEPTHARYVGFYVIYNVKRGNLDYDSSDWNAESADHHGWDATFTSLHNQLDTGTLHSGQIASGWVMFDVSASKITKLSFVPNYGEDAVGTWRVRI